MAKEGACFPSIGWNEPEATKGHDFAAWAYPDSEGAGKDGSGKSLTSYCNRSLCSSAPTYSLCKLFFKSFTSFTPL